MDILSSCILLVVVVVVIAVVGFNVRLWPKGGIELLRKHSEEN